jgi:hypothetical protein
MSITLILEVLVALLKFPAELGALVKLLSKTPEEKRQEIVLQVDKWLADSAASDRPKWEDQ